MAEEDVDEATLSSRGVRQLRSEESPSHGGSLRSTAFTFRAIQLLTYDTNKRLGVELVRSNEEV